MAEEQKDEEFSFEIEVTVLKSRLAVLKDTSDFVKIVPMSRNFEVKTMNGWLGQTWLEATPLPSGVMVNELELKDLFNVYALAPTSLVSLSEQQYHMYLQLLNANEDLYYIPVAHVKKYHQLQRTKLWEALIKEVPKMVNFDDNFAYAGVFRENAFDIDKCLSFNLASTHQEIALTKAQFVSYNKATAEINRVFVLPATF